MIIETLLILGAIIALAVISLVLLCKFRSKFVVPDGHAGLLYHEGKLSGVLPAGRHIRWGSDYRMTAIDLRRTLHAITGQEVLCADNVSVKLSVVLTLQVTDAAKYAAAADNPSAHLHNAAQVAIRSVIAAMSFDTLLAQRAAVGSQLLALLAPQAAALGIEIHAAEVRDFMLAAELRKAFSDVLKAKQEGQAALERARAESAALRSLANAARLVESQPTLATLRFLQTLESTHQTVVLNDLSILAAGLKTPAKGS